MKINDGLKSIYFYSKLGRKIGKQNLLIYKWTLNKKYNRPLSVSPAIEKIKFLYNIKKLKLGLKPIGDPNEEDNDIFSIEEKERQKLEELEENIEEKEYKRKSKNKKEEVDKDTKQKILGFESHKFTLYKKEDIKNKVEPSSTKYNPKYETILKRSASSPSWKLMQGRKEKIKVNNFPFYLEQGSIQNNMAGKSFVDFSKQSKRNFSIYKKEDIDIINLSKLSRSKSFFTNKRTHHRNNRNQSSLVISDYKSSKNVSKFSRPMSAINKHSSHHRNNESENTDSNNSRDSFDLFRQIYTSKLKKKKTKVKHKLKHEQKIKSIDFNQIISREDLEESKNKNIALVPYLFPNFSLVRERPQMMVVYDRKEHKKYKNKSNLDSMEFNSINYDSNKKHVHTPKFELMNMRPCDENDPYPSYMRGVFNKSALCKISSESLKESNYSNREFIMPLSSFWNNNSFNKYTNLKMLKGQSQFIDAFMNNENIEPKYKRLLKFYNKNYKVLMQGKTKYSRLEKDINLHMIQHKNKSIKDLINDLKKKD